MDSPPNDKHWWFFRMVNNIASDPKLLSLPMDQCWVFVCLMARASDEPGDRRGTLAGWAPPLRKKRLALEAARGDLALLDRTLDNLVALEVMAEEYDAAGTLAGWRFLNWAKYQEIPPSSWPEATRARQAASRARRRAQSQEPVTNHAAERDSHTLARDTAEDVTEIRDLSRQYNRVDHSIEDHSISARARANGRDNITENRDTSTDTPAPASLPITDEMYGWWVAQCQTRGLGAEKQDRGHLADLTEAWLADCRSKRKVATNWTAYWRVGMNYRLDWAVKDRQKNGGTNGSVSANSQWAAAAARLGAGPAADVPSHGGLQPGRSPAARPHD